MHSDDPQNATAPDAQPYSSPSMDFTSPYSPVMAHDVTGVRPIGLTVVGVLCTLDGIIGVLLGLMGVVQLFFAQHIANAFTAGSGPMMEAQQKMQQQVQTVNDAFFVPNLIGMLALLVLSVVFLVGGIGLLRDRNRARLILRKAMLFAIALEISRLVLQSIIQIKMMPIMEGYVADLTAGANNQGGSAAMSQFAMIGVVVGIVMWLIWSMIKVGLLIWGRIYLNRPNVIDYMSLQPVNAPKATVTG